MLLNKLFSIRSLTSDDKGSGFHADIILDPEHPVFKGHFPGNPILPGVCTVQIIKEVLEEALGKELMLTSAGNIKYLGFVNPQQKSVLDVDIKLTDDNACSAIVKADEQTACSFKGAFTP